MTRLRDFGVTPGRLPAGPLNAITDVPGVRVGHTTLISGETNPTRTMRARQRPHTRFAGTSRIELK